MVEFSDKLESIKQVCDEIENTYSRRDVAESIRLYNESAKKASKAFCGSWLGYHSRVYYKELQPIPAGARFSAEWGFMNVIPNPTEGEWQEYDFDGIYDLLTNVGAARTVQDLKELAQNSGEKLDDARENLTSILESMRASDADMYFETLKKDLKSCIAQTASVYVKHVRPKGNFGSRDMVALQAGLHTPPHISVQAKMFEVDSPRVAALELKKILARLSNHIENRGRTNNPKIGLGTKVFIGHGHSLVWKDLKDFINDRMKLPWEEFNRVSPAGVSTKERLATMLDSAVIAFIVMTAEDERPDGKLHARMNVVHEVGLFQGRLGFSRAIVVLEEGCEEFSNIHGLGQIRFPKGNIKACFEDIRLVLEREKLA